VPQHGHFVNTAVEALAGKNAQFRLRHVQPTAVLGVLWNSSRSHNRLAFAAGNASYSAPPV